jgi:gamma-glutamyltranspeptidase/glutathione hydrolase
MDRPPSAHLSTGPTSHGTGIAVSPHWMASEAGIDILRNGGSAADAAIAVDAVLGVVLPDTCGPGGDLFALVHDPAVDSPVALNASGRGGSGVSADDLRDRGLGEIPYRSPWSITVPGCVDGWEALSERFGKLPLSDVLSRAIEVARDGFPVSAELATSLDRIHGLVGQQPSAAGLYPGSEPPQAGAVLHRRALAEVLESVGRDGRDAFYRGAVGEGIRSATEGAVLAEDLDQCQADWITPASLDLFGRTAWTIPPNSQGYLTLAALWIFSHLDPPDDPNDPAFQHLLIEAYRSVAWEREDTVSDPHTTELDVSELLAPARLTERAERIRPDRAVRWPMPVPGIGGTAYMTVLDGDGMGISFIQSNFAGIGSGLSAGATGVWLHNRGAGFNLIPGHPNEYAPGKRPLHTLSPTLWTVDGALDLLLGTRGGDQQPQYLSQFAATHYRGGLCTDDSQSMPRWSMSQPEPGTDSAIEVESRFAASTVRGLEQRGHDVTVADPYEAGWGPISAIDVGGERKGSADPRISTSAALTT